MDEAVDREFQYRVWRYLAEQLGHPVTDGHGPVKADVRTESVWYSEWTGGDEWVTIEASCECGAVLEEREDELGVVVRGILAVEFLS